MALPGLNTGGHRVSRLPNFQPMARPQDFVQEGFSSDRFMDSFNKVGQTIDEREARKLKLDELEHQKKLNELKLEQFEEEKNRLAEFEKWLESDGDSEDGVMP